MNMMAFPGPDPHGAAGPGPRAEPDPNAPRAGPNAPPAAPDIDTRRGGPHPGPPLPDQIAAHLTTVADVLGEIANEIEDLGASLCVDPAVIINHIAKLQAIDLIAQKQRWLAAMLRADCPLAAVDTIGVDALRARFRRKGEL